LIRLMIMRAVLALIGSFVGAPSGHGAATASKIGFKATYRPGFAEGGPVHGPGTSTSDSIFARLSNGEFVIRAAAVRKWGVALFEQLNSLKTPALARGGYIGASLPMASSAVYNNQRSNTHNYFINVHGVSQKDAHATGQMIRRELTHGIRKDEARNG
jgi:hypothetical protein